MGFAALAIAAALAAATPPAQIPTRTCDQRAEAGGAPIRWRHYSGSVELGPLSFADLKRIAKPKVFEGFRYRDGYRVKAGVLLKAGRVATLSTRTSGAQLSYSQRESYGSAVRMSACDRDEPAFSYDGPVGAATLFTGGFRLKQAACVELTVRVHGAKRVYRKTVSFGAGRCP
jgi:hypothetical protein